MTRRDRGGLALVVALLVAAGGCGPNEEVSGIWDSLATPWLFLPPDTEPDPGCYFTDSNRHLRLVLGQYGYDVAGIVQFCPDRLCAPGGLPCCHPIEGGRMRGDTLSFTFPACAGEGRVRAELKLFPDPQAPRLEGPICPSGAIDCEEERYATIALEGRQQEKVSTQVKRCPTAQRCVPLDDASGAPQEDVGGGADAGE